jgi:hypothetical protein
MNTRQAHGAAAVLAVMAVFLMSALAASLAMLSNAELRIAASYVQAMELRYMAEAAMETVIQELATAADWNAAVAGPALSAFADGSPGGQRTLSDGASIDLDSLTGAIVATNPTARLFGFGAVRRLQPGSDLGVEGYAAVWIEDDFEENPAIVLLRASAFSAGGSRKTLDARVLRTDTGAVRIVSWTEAP